MDKKISISIRSTVHSFLPGAKVVLFGSRSRKEDTKDSDFDILIITKEQYPGKEKITWTGKIRKALIKSLHQPFDVLLSSEHEVEIKKKLPGHIIRWAIKEGLPL